MIFHLLILISTSCYSQYILNTPDGKKVELFKNGTWQYIDTNKDSHSKSLSLKNTKYISKFKKYTLSYDPQLWFRDTVESTELWDAKFYSIDKVIVGLCLESRLSYGNLNLDSLAKSIYTPIGNVKSFKGYNEVVDNLTVRFFDTEVESPQNGIVYRYLGFIYSSEQGSFQCYIGTQKNIVDEEYENILRFLKSFSKN